MPEVFVYGEIGPDNLIVVPWLPDSERAAPVLSDSIHPGGAASNVAILLANWGIPTALSGNALGKDPMGQAMVGFLEQYPYLDLAHLAVKPEAKTPFCRILVPPNGDRVVLFYNADVTIPIELSAADLNECRLLVLDDNGGEERMQAARVAREVNVPVLAGDIYHLDHPLLKSVRWITNSANLIHSKLAGVDVWEHVQALQAASGAIMIISDGPRAVRVFGPSGLRFSVTPQPVEVVDATGAGDALKAGIAYGLLHDWPIEECVRWGVAAGSLVVQQNGACTTPPQAGEITAQAETLSVTRE
jgi:sugar/nucleoside kinase (ribokinase family)